MLNMLRQIIPGSLSLPASITLEIMTETLLNLLILVVVIMVMAALTVYYLRLMMKSQREHLAAMLTQAKLGTEKLQLEKSLASQKQTLPIRMQACERLTLLLERIQPASLVMRTLEEASTARHLQQLLLRNIREEYEHNLSQQLYVSKAAWELVKGAREEALQLVNMAAGEVKETATKQELASALVVKKAAIADEALAKLKEEVAALF